MPSKIATPVTVSADGPVHVTSYSYRGPVEGCILSDARKQNLAIFAHRDDALHVARLINAEEKVREALKLSIEIHDEPCCADHHGQCQTHYLDPIDECFWTAAHAALAALKGESDAH